MKLAWILWLSQLMPQPAADSLCLSTTVYLEARDQSLRGQEAVAEVRDAVHGVDAALQAFPGARVTVTGVASDAAPAAPPRGTPPGRISSCGRLSVMSGTMSG